MSQHNRQRRRQSPRRPLDSATLLRRADAALRKAGRLTCDACGAPTDHVGLYVPNTAHQGTTMAPPGSTRSFAYRLCERCGVIPGNHERIGAAVLDHYRSVAGSPEVN